MIGRSPHSLSAFVSNCFRDKKLIYDIETSVKLKTIPWIRTVQKNFTTYKGKFKIYAKRGSPNSTKTIFP